jgi:hypothetical protein
LSLKYSGPFTVHFKLSYLNYVINTPDRSKKQCFCHVNSLKKYFPQNASVYKVEIVSSKETTSLESGEPMLDKMKPMKLLNSVVLTNLDDKL